MKTPIAATATLASYGDQVQHMMFMLADRNENTGKVLPIRRSSAFAADVPGIVG